MLDAVHLFLIALILVTSGAGIGVLMYMARLLGEARATTEHIAQISERVEASAERIAEMTREVLRRTS